MKETLKYKNIAIDFDNTIAYDAYPNIGSLIPHSDRVIRKIKEHGGNIIIWTCRSGEHEYWVRDFLEKHNIPYDTINEELTHVAELYGGSGRKVFADIYIDDKAIHCEKIDWLEIEKKLFITEELKVGDKLECIKAFRGLGLNPGDEAEITSIIEYKSIPKDYVINGACATDLEVIEEFFRKVD